MQTSLLVTKLEIRAVGAVFLQLPKCTGWRTGEARIKISENCFKRGHIRPQVKGMALWNVIKGRTNEQKTGVRHFYFAGKRLIPRGRKSLKPRHVGMDQCFEQKGIKRHLPLLVVAGNRTAFNISDLK
jgi:hypothetical protein